MNDRNKSNKLEGLQLGLFMFECGMAILYLVFAVIFIDPSLFHLQLNVQDDLRVAIGVIVGIYGIFRVYRAVKKIKELRNTEEE